MPTPLQSDLQTEEDEKNIEEFDHQVHVRKIFTKNELIWEIQDATTKEYAPPTFCIPPGGGKTLSILQAALYKPSSKKKKENFNCDQLLIVLIDFYLQKVLQR